MDRTRKIGWLLVLLVAVFEVYAACVIKDGLGLVELTEKSGTNALWGLLDFIFSNWVIFSAVLCYMAAPALWFVALNRLDISVAYPVLVTLHLIFVFAFGVFLFKEDLSVTKLIGAGLLMMSLWCFFERGVTVLKTEKSAA